MTIAEKTKIQFAAELADVLQSRCRPISELSGDGVYISGSDAVAVISSCLWALPSEPVAIKSKRRRGCICAPIITVLVGAVIWSSCVHWVVKKSVAKKLSIYPIESDVAGGM